MLFEMVVKNTTQVIFAEQDHLVKALMVCNASWIKVIRRQETAAQDTELQKILCYSRNFRRVPKPTRLGCECADIIRL